jgi:hypothetical protein
LGKWAVKEKKKQTILLYYPAIRTLLVIFNIFPLGLRTLTGWCDLRQYHPVGLTYRHVPVSELVLRTLADWQYHNLV